MPEQPRPQQIPILMYHSISQSANPRFRHLAVPREVFAEQLEYLYQHEYTFLTVTQLVQLLDIGGTLPERPVILTFDDGFADFFTDALPTLKHYNVTATLYVVTGFIGGTSQWLRVEGEALRPMLTWRQLEEIRACGIECGAHTHSHLQLGTLPSDIAQREITRCKDLLEQHLEQKVTTFAYPFGYYTAQVRQQVVESGFTSACAVKFLMNFTTTDTFALARFMIRPDMKLADFASLLDEQNSSFAEKLYVRTRFQAWQVARPFIGPLRQMRYQWKEV